LTPRTPSRRLAPPPQEIAAMRKFPASALLALGLLLAAQAWAADTTPVGTWTQIDDTTGKPKSLIEITEQPDGTLQAVVKQVYFSDQGTTHPICKACAGERHNKPVVGMQIMWGVKKDGDVWDGGKILDPAKGKSYRVELSLRDGGQKLDVKGFLLFFHRTQTWIRKTD
jgi:uncharacterized protein (DUF2147 family)